MILKINILFTGFWIVIYNLYYLKEIQLATLKFLDIFL